MGEGALCKGESYLSMPCAKKISCKGGLEQRERASCVRVSPTSTCRVQRTIHAKGGLKKGEGVLCNGESYFSMLCAKDISCKGGLKQNERAPCARVSPPSACRVQITFHTKGRLRRGKGRLVQG